MSANVYLNTASVDDLATLPGIGKTLAARILAYREQFGAFSDVSDLLAVDGITQRKLDGIRGLVDVGRSDDTPPREGGEPPPKQKDNGGDDDNGEETVGPGKHHGGDPVRIHEEYVRYHLEGDTPATAETYERARGQFRRLPGAVQRAPSEVSFEPIKEQPEDEPDEAEE